MNKMGFLFESSPWLVLLCLLGAILLAGLLYYKISAPWNSLANKLLAAARFVLVLVICLLLLSPLLRQIINTTEAPAIVLAIDNSLSISEVISEDSLAVLFSKIDDLREKLIDAGYHVDVRSLTQTDYRQVSDIAFEANETNLDNLLEDIRIDYESRNLASVVVFSDGIYNTGNNPTFKPLSFNVHTVGMGDTIPKADVRINDLLYNKIAYQGNKFPIVAEIVSDGMQNRTLEVQAIKGGKVIDRQRLEIKDDHQFNEVTFQVEASEEGMQQYAIYVVPQQDEFTQANNRKDAYVDVIEGKEKILLVAPAPHPDIKAFRSALSKNQNYEFEIWIPGVRNQNVNPEDYGTIILHQVPDNSRQFADLLVQAEAKNIPLWFVIGQQSNINEFNRINGIMRIARAGQQTDNVFPVLNSNFRTFKINEDFTSIFDNYTPVKVPFGSFTVNDAAEVLLYQRIGNVRSNKPLMLIQNLNGRKSAVMLGEGMWQWRVQEYAKTEKHEAFDDLIVKVVQYLSTKDDKRRFKVYPLKNEYIENETVVFEAEVYNEIYELTYGHKIDLTIKDEAGESKGYTFVTSEQNAKYPINDLTEGVYSYEAKATINGIVETASGKFAIRKLQVETTFITANHNLLRNLANANSGNFYTQNALEELSEKLTNLEASARIYSSEDYLSVINLRWLFFLLLLLAAVEWFFRKYLGGY